VSPGAAVSRGNMRFEPFDLDDMQLFIRVAESHSLTYGAQRSYMSLPAASMRVKNIEGKIGTQLLHRRQHGVDLTPAGHTFLRYSLLTLRNVESLMTEIRDYANDAKTHLRVSANTNAMEFMPGVLSAFLSARPGVSIDLKQGGSSSIVRAVADGSADIGIVADKVHTEGLKVWPYKRDRVVVAVPLGHSLSDREAIDFSDTLDFDYIILSEQNAMQIRLREAAREIRQPMKVRIQVGGFDRMCQMIAAGVGIGILSESIARRSAENGNIRLLQLKDSWAIQDLQICVRNPALLPPFAKSLIDILVEDAASSALDLLSLPGRPKSDPHDP
jgi:DNA-binding transcriptional LysR family regulator